MSAGRKLRQISGQLRLAGGEAERLPRQRLQLCPGHSLADAAGEARQVIAEILDPVAILDEIPIGELFGLADLLGGQRPEPLGEGALVFQLGLALCRLGGFLFTGKPRPFRPRLLVGVAPDGTSRTPA